MSLLAQHFQMSVEKIKKYYSVMSMQYRHKGGEEVSSTYS